MIFGISLRKNRKRHVPIMALTILWDILLILQIELTRSAIDKASKVPTNAAILNIHVSFAITSVILYFVLIYTGRKLLKGDKDIRSKHKLFGWSAFVFRTLTLLTSFYAVE